MTLAVVMMAIGLIWLSLRKWIARRQHAITEQMFGGSEELQEERTKGLEQLGVFFSVVLILGGLAILTLTLIFQPPWEGSN